MPIADYLPQALLVDKVVDIKDRPGEVKVVPTTIDVKTRNMPTAAHFIAPKIKTVWLVSFKDRVTAVGRERIPDSGCRISFIDHKRIVDNKRLLELILNSNPFILGRIKIDPDDPSGFWEDNGMITKKQITVTDKVINPKPKFDELNLSDEKAPEAIKENISGIPISVIFKDGAFETTPNLQKTLEGVGVVTVENALERKLDGLLQIHGIGVGTAPKIIEVCERLVS